MTMGSLTLDDLDQVQALRARIELQPVDGAGGRVFPMTVEGGQHVLEDGPDGRRVLVDSCASQANRQELALLTAREQGLLELADIVVDLAGTQAGRRSLSTLEMPHRLADAILRDSEIEGIAFPKSELGQRILAAAPQDLSPLLETGPASLVFGTWFSQHKLGNRALKIERASVSEIWGHSAQLGRSIGSRIDPLGLVDMPIYTAKDGGWTADPDEAATDGRGKPVLNPKGEKTTKLLHSNIPPSSKERGVICERYELRWSLSGAALRKLGFGGGERDRAARRYLMALGLAARVLAHEDGYALRSRCHLIPTGPLAVEAVGRYGEVTADTIDGEAALALLRVAQDGMVAAGFAAPRLIRALPGRSLVKLIAKSREVAPVEEAA